MVKDINYIVMRKIIFVLIAVSLCGVFASCCDDEWGNNNPAMEHIYYYGLDNEAYPGGNEKVYNVAQGQTVAIPSRFWSAFTRSYSPEVYYYTYSKNEDGEVLSSPELVCGVDYQVVDQDGKILVPDENEAYSMVWPNAKQGVQNIYIKALNGNKGTIRVLTFDPKKTMSSSDVSSTTIVKTSEYEVRAFTENYYVTVHIQ